MRKLELTKETMLIVCMKKDHNNFITIEEYDASIKSYYTEFKCRILESYITDFTLNKNNSKEKLIVALNEIKEFNNLIIDVNYTWIVIDNIMILRIKELLKDNVMKDVTKQVDNIIGDLIRYNNNLKKLSLDLKRNIKQYLHCNHISVMLDDFELITIKNDSNITYFVELKEKTRNIKI